MAISANCVWEVRNVADYATASDTNGGGWVTGSSGTDWSQQGGPQYSVTDGVTAGTTTITSATAAFGTDVVGNIISVSGGTGSVAQGWYQIISRTNATTIVVDRSTGLTSGTGVTLKIGGALATIGQAGALLSVAGMTVWWKYSTTDFTATTATVGAAGPCSFAVVARIEGYDQSRGDRTGNRPRFNWGSVTLGSVTYAITSTTNAHVAILNVAINCNSVTNASGISANFVRSYIVQCIVSNASAASCVGFLATDFVACEAISCATGFSNSGGTGVAVKCVASACGAGFSGMQVAFKCLATACTTGGFVTLAGTTYGVYSQCTSDACTAASSIGFDLSIASVMFAESCISSNNNAASAIGFKVSSGVQLATCASYNNTTEVSGTPMSNEGMILNASFSGQPYTVAGSDFRPNVAAGAGALLRGAGIGVYGQTDNVDIGAVQHSDPSAVISKVMNSYYFNDIEAA